MIQQQAPTIAEALPPPTGEAGAGNRRRFYWLFLPSWLLLTGLFAAAVVGSLRNAEETKTQAAVNLAHHLEHFVRTEIKALVSDALLLRAQPDLQAYLLDKNPREVSALAQSYLAFCQGKPALRQVTLLDDQGRRLLRVGAGDGRFQVSLGPLTDPPAREEDPRLAAAEGLAANEIIIYSPWRPASPAERANARRASRRRRASHDVARHAEGMLSAWRQANRRFAPGVRAPFALRGNANGARLRGT